MARKSLSAVRAKYKALRMRRKAGNAEAAPEFAPGGGPLPTVEEAGAAMRARGYAAERSGHARAHAGLRRVTPATDVVARARGRASGDQGDSEAEHLRNRNAEGYNAGVLEGEAPYHGPVDSEGRLRTG